MNIRSRFAIAGVVSTCVVLAGVSGVIVRQSTAELRHNFDIDLTSRFQASAPIIATAPSMERLIDTLSANATESGVRVIRDGNETRIGDMPLNPPQIPDRQLTTVTANGESWRAYVATISVDASISNQPVQVQMYAPTQKLDDRIHFIRRRVGAIFATSVGITALLSWFIGGYATRPLRRLAESVKGYQSGSELKIPNEQGVVEVDALGETIRNLLQQLGLEHQQTRVALQSAREFSWNAVHELRTPLMSMRTDMDTLRSHPLLDAESKDQLLASVVRQHERINATLTALHDLGRGELQTADSTSDADLSEIIEVVVEGLRSTFPNVRIDLDVPQNLHARVWPEGIEIAVRNLVLNAIKHGKPDAHVRVEAREGDSTARIVVEDNGPGIPEEQRARVFERFARGTTTNAGTGLGLALVRQQAELHNGSVAIENSVLGGARFVLTLRLQP